MVLIHGQCQIYDEHGVSGVTESLLLIIIMGGGVKWPPRPSFGGPRTSSGGEAGGGGGVLEDDIAIKHFPITFIVHNQKSNGGPWF